MLECKLPPSFVKKLYELRAFSYPQTMSYQQAKKVAKDIVANIDTYYKEFNAALAIADSKQRADAMTAAEQNLAGVMEKSELHPLFDRDEIQAAYKAKADEILKTYHIELAETVKIKPSAPKETAILRCIAKCCQDLFQHHVFFDGNTRTDVFLAMNKLLLQNNLCPVIMDNPNVIAMHSLDQIVELMRQGQDTFRSLCR
jgi:prophage maintenance system killer protein